jgi:hypothetical protein
MMRSGVCSSRLAVGSLVGGGREAINDMELGDALDEAFGLEPTQVRTKFEHDHQIVMSCACASLSIVEGSRVV